MHHGLTRRRAARSSPPGPIRAGCGPDPRRWWCKMAEGAVKGHIEHSNHCGLAARTALAEATTGLARRRDCDNASSRCAPAPRAKDARRSENLQTLGSAHSALCAIQSCRGQNTNSHRDRASASPLRAGFACVCTRATLCGSSSSSDTPRQRSAASDAELHMLVAKS